MAGKSRGQAVRSHPPKMSGEITDSLSSQAKAKKEKKEEQDHVPRKRAKISTQEVHEVMGEQKDVGKIISIKLVDAIADDNALATVNIDISSLLDAAISQMQGTGVTETAQPYTRRRELLDMAKTKAEARAHAFKPKKTSFVDLPAEIRRDIYRKLFYTDDIVDLEARKGMKRSSQFLRTCRLVHHEGRPILYGENSFHFGRSNEIRGQLFEEQWREIGYKDALAFLEMIGNDNIVLLKFVSFIFSDASTRICRADKSMNKQEKRFVNDATLHQCLRLIGQNARLEKFAVTFFTKAAVRQSDYPFLDALTSIKAYDVVHCRTFGYSASNDRYNAFANNKARMILERSVEVNPDQNLLLKRPMWHDLHG